MVSSEVRRGEKGRKRYEDATLTNGDRKKKHTCVKVKMTAVYKMRGKASDSSTSVGGEKRV